MGGTEQHFKVIQVYCILLIQLLSLFNLQRGYTQRLSTVFETIFIAWILCNEQCLKLYL